ncbi:MAG: hypothetical protein IT331_08645 [Anaerolineae bacterium]|nr:hypothetical protein [Anaerolineae bacterium]
MNRRRRIETDRAPASIGYRSNAMLAAGFLFTGGHIGVPLSSPENRVLPVGTLAEQADIALSHMHNLMLAGGGDLKRVIEVAAFIVPADGEEIVRERTRAFLGYAPPLFHADAVADVALHGLLEVDGIALADSSLTIAEAAEILRPFGSESGMIHSGAFIIINGLTGPGSSLGEQTRNLFQNAASQLEQVGSNLSNLVKLTVYTSDYAAYPEFNDVTRELFAGFDPPTRSVVIAPQITAGAFVRVNLIALAG